MNIIVGLPVPGKINDFNSIEVETQVMEYQVDSEQHIDIGKLQVRFINPLDLLYVYILEFLKSYVCETFVHVVYYKENGNLFGI